MGVYLDAFSLSERIPFEQLRTQALTYLPDANVVVFTNPDYPDVEDITITIGDDEPVCEITVGPPMEDDPDWVSGDLEGKDPANAVAWVLDRLPQVKTFYRFRFLYVAFENRDNGLVGGMARWVLQGRGFLRDDFGAYYNADDRMVVWAGDPDPKGHHEAAVLDGEGRWVAFAMDLGDSEHQAAFRAGRVPDGAVQIAHIEGTP